MKVFKVFVATIALSLGLSFFCSSAEAQGGEIYSWVGPKGYPYFTNVPTSESVRVNSSLPPAPVFESPFEPEWMQPLSEPGEDTGEVSPPDSSPDSDSDSGSERTNTDTESDDFGEDDDGAFAGGDREYDDEYDNGYDDGGYGYEDDAQLADADEVFDGGPLGEGGPLDEEQ